MHAEKTDVGFKKIKNSVPSCINIAARTKSFRGFYAVLNLKNGK